ncbi:MAG: M20/M25/M40 family metallo-hydrolase [Planctomycetota bacterium]|nr:M20/M25/M40 family metallo-hydrolase [Planctomycetota bacterium]
MISRADLKSHVDALADDTFEGRAAGTRGGRAAAGYLRKHLASLGLEGGGRDGTFAQPFRNGCQNLLAIIPGNDPALRDEYIVIGAHYDHVGYGSRSNSYGPTGYIHNGADDNASGTAALLELAEAFTVQPSRRSILIAFWDAEEKGLWGSKHFISNPTIPLENIKLALNMDMVGRLRNNQLTIYGTRTWENARSILASVNTNMVMAKPMEINFDWEIKPNSDHHPFYLQKIPYFMPHTGLHDDYHRPRDDAHKINSAGIEAVARFTFQTVMLLDELDQMPAFRDSSKRETPFAKRRFEKPLKAPEKRLGVRWASEENSSGGLTVTGTDYNSPARVGGIRRGDRMISFNGILLTSDDAMRSAVFNAPSKSNITLIRRGDDTEEQVEVVLRGKPMRLGLSWREDTANPNTPMVSRIIPGSPAANAGLTIADRIHAVNGQQWESSEARHPFQGVEFPITIMYERNGSLDEVILTEGGQSRQN